ncbi:DUF1501 domain-containing protein [Fimbriiglobus ruber]|uniref:Sulfatase n=1 Tax=Fimbriiglobus ruber TaxID=1908690 RepID=A0A225DPX8_9BACT|nr:DUF1501 domain-containing protein [Fimbriiglobus ruber]OWK43153.1 hypothetical protein FRUB_02752 [Fimbriiglobus ruber]
MTFPATLAQTRRQFVRSAVAGTALFPAILSQLLAEDSPRGESADPLAPKPPHFPAKAKNVIFLFMSGGVSHVDTFDPKPKLFADHGKLVTLDHPETRNRPGYDKLFLKRPQWEFTKRGKSGTEVSSLFPHVGALADDFALIRSMHADHSNHYNATLGMHTGSVNQARPSIGAWLSYGLGTVNRNLPSFVVLAPQTPYAGGQVWASDFLPGSHQGTLVVPGPEPMRNVRPAVPPARQRTDLDALADLNRAHLDRRPGDPDLAARVQSFETAFGMQTAAPEAFDLTKETDETHALYGLPRGSTNGFAWQCLAARRLVERGVRFVELIDTGSSNNWDSHGDMNDHARLAKNVDKPIAGLLTDLKRRGLLDSTLVVWTTEFGRTPFNNSADAKGREHHPWAFSSWLAGAGIKGGTVHGTTDEYGVKVATDGVHVHDYHATILHLMGLDHTKLTYRHSGRDYRLTDVAGNVVKEVLA